MSTFYQISREKDAKRKAYTMLVERVFRREELNQDKVLGKSDLDAMEKEVSIDIAELTTILLIDKICFHKSKRMIF